LQKGGEQRQNEAQIENKAMAKATTTTTATTTGVKEKGGGRQQEVHATIC